MRDVDRHPDWRERRERRDQATDARPASVEPSTLRPGASPWIDVGRFSLQSALIHDTGLSAHCEAHLRSVIRSIIPD